MRHLQCWSSAPHTVIHFAFFVGSGCSRLFSSSKATFSGRYFAPTTPFLKREMIEWKWKKLKIYKLFSPYWKWLLVTDYSDQNREKVSFKNIAVFENTLFQLDVQRHPEYCCLILHLSYCSRSICQFLSKEYQLFIFSRFQTIYFLFMISLLPLYFSVSPKNKFVLYMYSRIWHSIQKKPCYTT